MRSLYKFSFLVLIPLLWSCGASRKAETVSLPAGSLPQYASEYINRYSSMAVKEMERSGVPASITLAQGMLESDYGRSFLAVSANNHFGIKCHSDWGGEKTYKDDDRRNECFRRYPSVDESYRDHSDFLVNGSRYDDLFLLERTDYKGWAHGLKKAGYATDPNYPALLIRKIDEYGLHAFDFGTADPGGKKGKSAVSPAAGAATATAVTAAAVSQGANVTPASRPDSTAKADQSGQNASSSGQPTQASVAVVTLSNARTGTTNGVKYAVIRQGDSFQTLAEEFGLLAWEIRNFNELPSSTTLSPGQIIYLEPKKSKAADGNAVHVAASGETMHDIAQKYAVKLSALYKMNVMEEGSQCVPGQKVRVR